MNAIVEPQSPPSLIPPTTEVKSDPLAPPAAPPPAPTSAEPKPEEKKVEAAPAAPFDVKSLKLPEGFTLDEKLGGEFSALLNDDKLSRGDLAQKLVDMQIAREKATAEEGERRFVQLQEQWVDAVKKDPEVGGDKFDASLSAVGRLVDKYGTKEAREAFTATGAGNNPHIFKMLVKMAGDLNEGAPVSGAPASTADLMTSMYPTMQGKK